MVARRRWKEWPGRLSSELNGIAGYSGVGGTLLAVGGLAVLTGPVGIGLAVAGGLVAGGALSRAVWKSIPAQLSPPSDHVGSYLSLDSLAPISPRITTFAVVGPSSSGKTTLKDRVAQLPSKTKRTQSISGYIHSFATVPTQYVAILDGSGDRFAQQFEIAAAADIVCVVLDHNSSAADPTISQDRMKESVEFLRQIRDYLVDKRHDAARTVYLLLNKSDLWQTNSEVDQAPLLKFFNDEVRKWAEGAKAGTVTSDVYSNERANDTANLVKFLIEHTRN